MLPAELLRMLLTSAQSKWRARGEVVPALHGLAWIRDAWRIFWERPWTWFCGSGMCVGWYTLLVHIPVVGKTAAALLTPLFCAIFFGQYAFWAHRQTLGEHVSIWDVHDDVAARFGQHALLGLCALIPLGILFAANRGFGDAGALSDLVSRIPESSLLGPAARRSLRYAVMVPIVYIVLILPVFLAPTLVTIGERNVVDALRDGMGAMFRNRAAFLAHCLAMLLLVLAVEGMVLSYCLIPYAVGDLSRRALRILLVGASWLRLLTTCFYTGLFALTGYAAARDIFYDEGPQ